MTAGSSVPEAARAADECECGRTLDPGGCEDKGCSFTSKGHCRCCAECDNHVATTRLPEPEPIASGVPAGASVAAMRAYNRTEGSGATGKLKAALEATYPHIVAAAVAEERAEVEQWKTRAFEGQQKRSDLITRLAASERALAEERATTGRLVEWLDDHAFAEGSPVPDDVISAYSLGWNACIAEVRAALASPGEGE